MKDALSSLELHALVTEFQSLVGSRLDKAYQGGGERKHDLLLQFHQTDEGKKLLRIILPGLVFLTSGKEGYGKMPGHFAIFLRRRLGNARLVRIGQRGFERILELSFEKKDGRFILLVELLPPGDLLLLDEEGKILGLLQPQRHGQRLLRGGAQYEPPPPTYDTRNATPEEIAAHLAGSKKDAVVKALAADLGLGRRYAEEVCARAAIEKSAPLVETDLAAVAAVVTALLAEPIAAVRAGEEVFPFPLVTQEAEEEFSSFSAAIETRAPSFETAAAEAAVREQKAVDILQIQQAQLAGYRRAAEENQRKGELLYEHYQGVERLLHALNEDRKTLSWNEIKKKYAGRAEIDETKGELTIELGKV